MTVLYVLNCWMINNLFVSIPSYTCTLNRRFPISSKEEDVVDRRIFLSCSPSYPRILQRLALLLPAAKSGLRWNRRLLFGPDRRGTGLLRAAAPVSSPRTPGPPTGPVFHGGEGSPAGRPPGDGDFGACTLRARLPKMRGGGKLKERDPLFELVLKWITKPEYDMTLTLREAMAKVPRHPLFLHLALSLTRSVSLKTLLPVFLLARCISLPLSLYLQRRE